jgi:hypothetical protein
MQKAAAFLHFFVICRIYYIGVANKGREKIMKLSSGERVIHHVGTSINQGVGRVVRIYDNMVLAWAFLAVALLLSALLYVGFVLLFECVGALLLLGDWIHRRANVQKGSNAGSPAFAIAVILLLAVFLLPIVLLSMLQQNLMLNSGVPAFAVVIIGLLLLIYKESMNQYGMHACKEHKNVWFAVCQPSIRLSQCATIALLLCVLSRSQPSLFFAYLLLHACLLLAAFGAATVKLTQNTAL